MSLNPLQDFYKQTITAPTGTGAGKIYLSAKPIPTNGYVVISPSNQTLREIIRYTGTGTDSGGDYINVASASDRGLGGTSAQAHSTGESVRVNLVSSAWADLISELNTLNTKIDTAVISGALDATQAVKGISFLTANPEKTLGTATITIASPAVITKVAHGLQAGDSVKFTTTDTLPTGITAGATYYVIATDLTTDTFKISATYGGSALNTTGSQAGTHTLIRLSPYAVGDNDVRIPTTGQGQALAGAQGTPSSVNKYVTEDKISTGYNDSQLTRNAGTDFGVVDTVSARNKIAQSFVARKTKMRGVALYKDADTGTFTGTVTVGLYADSGGSPTGSALATATISNAEWLAKGVGEFFALFSSEYSSMVVGDTYWFLVSSSTADNSNHPNLGINSAGGYADGVVKRWNTADGYVLVTTIDLYFKILDGINNQLFYGNPTKPLVRIFSVAGANTYTPTAGVKKIMVEVIGAGQGGGRQYTIPTTVAANGNSYFRSASFLCGYTGGYPNNGSGGNFGGTAVMFGVNGKGGGGLADGNQGSPGPGGDSFRGFGQSGNNDNNWGTGYGGGGRGAMNSGTSGRGGIGGSGGGYAMTWLQEGEFGIESIYIGAGGGGDSGNQQSAGNGKDGAVIITEYFN